MTSEPPKLSRGGSLAEIARTFLKLGCISFGGPVAHLGYLHEEFVRPRSTTRSGAKA